MRVLTSETNATLSFYPFVHSVGLAKQHLATTFG